MRNCGSFLALSDRCTHICLVSSCTDTLSTRLLQVGHVLRMGDEGDGAEEIFTELGVITGVWNKDLVLQDGKKKTNGQVIWTNRAVGTESRKFFKPANILDPMDTWYGPILC